MSIERAASSIEIEVHRDMLNTVDIPSRYHFLSKHKGIRPNSLHGAIGSMGCGKSTLLKCIIAEAATGKEVLVWLSEEDIIEYQYLINYLDSSVLDNITFVDEKKIPAEIKDNQQDFFEYFVQMYEEAMPDLIFIDNVTTSAFYDMRFSFTGCQKTADFLLHFVKKYVSIFYMGHTKTEVTDNYSKPLTPEDIRGHKALAIKTEYMYLMQKFTNESRQYNVIKNAKYRHHKEAAGWYALVFEQEAYIGDKPVSFSVVNKIFKTRDHFGKKLPTIKKEDDGSANKDKK